MFKNIASIALLIACSFVNSSQSCTRNSITDDTLTIKVKDDESKIVQKFGQLVVQGNDEEWKPLHIL